MDHYRPQDARSDATRMYCAGLPYVGERSLSDEEITALRRGSRWRIAGGCLLPFGGTLGLITVALLVGALIGRLPEKVMGILAILLAFVVVGGIALSFVQGRDWSRKGTKLRRVWSAGKVRRFEGPLSFFDHTDHTLHFLAQGEILFMDPSGQAVIEVLSDCDELYSLNGFRPKIDIPVMVTIAVPRPENVTTYDMPGSWGEPVDDANVGRRRPTANEREEMRYYTRLSYKYWFRKAWTTLVFAAGSGLVGFHIIGTTFKFVESFYKPSFEPLNVMLAFGGLIAVAAIALMGLVINDDIRLAQKIRKDIEFDWIFAASFEELDEAELPPGSMNVFERLPVSGLHWTIGGKPAAWRKYSALVQNKSG